MGCDQRFITPRGDPTPPGGRFEFGWGAGWTGIPEPPWVGPKRPTSTFRVLHGWPVHRRVPRFRSSKFLSSPSNHYTRPASAEAKEAALGRRRCGHNQTDSQSSRSGRHTKGQEGHRTLGTWDLRRCTRVNWMEA